MKKKISWFILLTLALGLIVSAPASATIIWVSEYHDQNSDGIVDDQGWIDFLEDQGYEVDLNFTNGAGTTLDAAKIVALNGADLIIFSRCSSSGNYAGDATEVAQWNSITTPLIQLSAYCVRNTVWKWLDSGTAISAGGAPLLRALVPEDPIFEWVTLNENQVDILDETVGSGNTTFVEAADAGNGTALARPVGNDGWMWIAEWDEGVEFYIGAGQIAGGPRILFCAGTNGADNGPRGGYNLTTQGEIMFLNAVQKFLAGNRRPIVEAGAYQSLLWPGSPIVAQLVGSVNDDGEPNPPGAVTSVWSQLSGPGTVDFSDTSIEDPTATFSAAGLYILQLSASDGEKDACDVVDIYIRPDNDPIARWNFEEGLETTVGDSSAYNNVGTFVGEPNWVAGWVGDWAVDVADNSYVEITTDATMDPNLDTMYGEVTVSAWVKVDEWLSSSWDGIVTKGKGNGTPSGYGGWLLMRNSSTDSLAFSTPGAGIVRGSVNIKDGNWHHVAGVHNGTTISLYVDGVLDTSEYASGLVMPKAAKVWINGNSESEEGDELFFDGMIDDVQIYSYAISESQITELVALGQGVPPQVDAGADETFYIRNGSFQLNATVVDETAPQATLLWTQESGPGTVEFSDATIEDPTATFSEVGEYLLRLTADDPLGVVYDDVMITVENPICQDVIDDGLLIPADFSGPEGEPDCRIDIYDFAAFASNWLRCNDPQDVGCEYPY